MFQAQTVTASSKTEQYTELAAQLEGLLHGERDLVANAANTSAFLMMMLPDLNWAGFYFLRDDRELVVGPFQGKPACVRIPVGRGVCGTAVAKRTAVVVPDVDAFAGHIACDTGSRSELVVPLVKDGKVLGVIDLDSPKLARFDDDDRHGLERLATIFVAASY